MLIYRVEELIEELYDHISITPEYRKLLQAWLFDEIDRMNESSISEIADLEKQRKKLKDEEGKLLQAHYAEAISLELLKTEQQRISKTLGDIDHRLSRLTANVGTMKNDLTQVLSLLEDCGKTYREADDYGKRPFNQAIFEKIVVNSIDTIEPKYSEVVELLIDSRLRCALESAGSATETALSGESAPDTTTAPSLAETADTAPDKRQKRKKPTANTGNGLLGLISDTVNHVDNFFVGGLRRNVLVGVTGVWANR